MLTTNMPQLVQEIERISEVHVHDTGECLELLLPRSTDMAQVEDLLCDALFAEPEQRIATADGWLILLNKLSRPRKAAADMQVLRTNGVFQYVLRAA